MQKSTQKLAKQIRESMQAYSNDLFKELREGLSGSLDKVQETIENCLNKTKSEMKQFVEQMREIAKSAKLEMPIVNSETQIKPMQSVSQKVDSIRGPPKTISQPTINLSATKSQFDIVNASIEIQKKKLQELQQQYINLENSIGRRNEMKESLIAQNELIKSLKNEIRSLENSPLEIRLQNLDELERLRSTLREATKEATQLDNELSSKKSIGLEGNLNSVNEKILKLKSSLNSNNIKKSSLESSIDSIAKGSKINRIKQLSSAIVKLGKTFKNIGSKIKSAIKHISGFISKITSAKKGTNGYKQSIGSLIRTFTIFSLVFPLVTKGIRSLGTYLLSSLKTNNQFASSLNEIKSNLQTAFTPIFNAILPAMNSLMSILAKATAYISAFVSAIFGKSLSQTKKATAGINNARDALNSTGSSAKKVSNAIKEATRSLMGFDEINNLNKDTKSSDSGNSEGSIYSPSNIDTSSISDFAKKLKDMWTKGDYSGIGEEIGKKINNAVLSFTKFISWEKIGNKITNFIVSFCETFNSLINAINWESVGNMFATGINTIANTLYILLRGIDWKRLGEALGEGINGLVHNVNWEKFGATIGSFLKAKIDALYGFVTTADWDGIGKALGDSVMGIVNKVDFKRLGLTFGRSLKGVISTAHNFVDTIDWTGLGQKIGSTISNFFSSVNWADLGMTLSDAIKGIISLFSETIMNTSWEDIGQAIADCIINIDWGGIILGLGDLLVRLILGLALSIGKAFVEIAKAMWDGLCKGVEEFFADPGKFIKEKIVDPFVNWVKSLFGIHSPSTVMHEIGGYVMKGLINGLKSMPIVGSIAGLIGDGITWIKDQYSNFKEKGKELFENIKSGIANNPIVKTVGGAISDGVTAVKNKCGEFMTKGKEIMSNLKNGVEGGKTNPINQIANVASSMASKIASGAINKAGSWGSDMMSGLASGIKGATKWVTNAVSNVAGTISSWLHFTRPDVGPLREYEKWMPDFMKGMREGIERNKSSLLDSVKSISNDMANSFDALQQPEIAFAGSQDISITHFVKSENSKEDILRGYIEELKNRNNDDTQAIVSVLYELLDALNEKEVRVDADALNESNRKKDYQRKLRIGR